MAEALQIVSFRRLIDDQVTEFVNASRQFGEPLTALAYMVKRAFDLELNFIVAGTNATGPPEPALLNSLHEPLSGVLREIQEFRDRNRHVEEFFNHLSTVSESLVALSWISIGVDIATRCADFTVKLKLRPAPCQFIRDMRESGEYFGNRVLSTYRGNQRHQAWIHKYNEILKALEQYVKEYHLTGFNWGVPASGTGGTGGGPEIPPPPPPLPRFTDISGAGGDDRHALLNQINQGVEITRMLRPVRRDDDAQPQQAAPAVVPVHRTPPARAYPPKFILEGRKWRVEHQKDNYSLAIDNDEMCESLAMFKCQNVGLEVRNKMNGVSIDNCKRSTIVLHDIISSVELIRCENVKVQCSGHVPLISLDNCDSIQVFLTDQSIDAEVISSKSSSLNICLLAPDGDYTELAVPEQIRTVVVDRRLVSRAVEKI